MVCPVGGQGHLTDSKNCSPSSSVQWYGIRSKTSLKVSSVTLGARSFNTLLRHSRGVGSSAISSSSIAELPFDTESFSDDSQDRLDALDLVDSGVEDLEVRVV
jgi:hypothetical protein